MTVLCARVSKCVTCLIASFFCLAPDMGAPVALAQSAESDKDSIDSARKQRAAEIKKIEVEIRGLELKRRGALRVRDVWAADHFAAEIRRCREQLNAVKKKSLEDYRRAVPEEQHTVDAVEEQAQAEVIEQAKRSERVHAFSEACEKSGCPLLLDEPEAMFLKEYKHANPAAPHIYSYFKPDNGMFAPGAYVRTTVCNRLQEETITAWEIKAELLDAFGKVLARKSTQGIDLPAGKTFKTQINLPSSEGGHVVQLSVEKTNTSDGTTWQREAGHMGVMWRIKNTQRSNDVMADIEIVPNAKADGSGVAVDGGAEP